jgi:hypothetical protein
MRWKGSKQLQIAGATRSLHIWLRPRRRLLDSLILASQRSLSAWRSGGRPAWAEEDRRLSWRGCLEGRSALEDRNGDLFCHSLEPGEIAERLADVDTDPGACAAGIRNSRWALGRYLTMASMKAQLHESLGLGLDSLPQRTVRLLADCENVYRVATVGEGRVLPSCSRAQPWRA